MKDILLITPPFTQLNTPYPATAYLKGFLNTRNISSFQLDLGIEVILDIFSKEGLIKLFDASKFDSHEYSENSQRIYQQKERYIHIIDDVISFLQGRNQSYARQLCSQAYLPKASRFDQLHDVDWAFGEMGFQDKAKHLSTLFLEDVSDFIIECVDPHFGFSRYAEKLGRSAYSFDEINDLLQEELSFIDEITIAILQEKIAFHKPRMVGFSLPFPGNLFSAFRCAQYIKNNHPEISTIMGGGFPNTELRSLKDKRVFEYFDFISLDDGELPLELIITKVLNVNNCTKHVLKRTYVLENEKLVYHEGSNLKDYSQHDIACPDYTDLKFENYISVIEVVNPMHSLWSDGRWIKLTMAHGCYWGKCTFCDVSLDYIKLYEPIAAKALVDRVEILIKQTGEKGFHFVDEAAPPALMKAFALEILKRGLTISWWTNIRFEKNFTLDLCQLLKASGCIAVSGGLEVASDRLLELIDKGVSVKQVAQVTHHFSQAGIMVHAYLMYGYPSQSIQETVDSLEYVRQLFESGTIQSGFWHQFALTAHSPIGQNAEAYGIRPLPEKIEFANNDIEFIDETGIDHSQFSYGLKKSLYNFMHGIGFDIPVQDWFEFELPHPSVDEHYIQSSIEAENPFSINPTDRIVWIGPSPKIRSIRKKQAGKKVPFLSLSFPNDNGNTEVKFELKKGEWVLELLKSSALVNEKLQNYRSIRSSFENSFADFELFWNSKEMLKVRHNGLLLI